MVSSSRFKHIDALRGIAVLLVIWLHVSEVYINLSPAVKAHSTFLYDFAWYINSGRIGVVLFFAISGFVLLKSIKGNRKRATKTFWTRRFFRLYPAFWVSVLLGFFVMELMDKKISVGMLVANITMLPQILNQEMILGLYWTLETEILFYCIGWLLFMVGKSHNPINLFIVSIFFLGFFIVSRIAHFSNTQHIGLVSLPFFLSSG